MNIAASLENKKDWLGNKMVNPECNSVRMASSSGWLVSN